jgi:hypothetical protein
MPAVLAATTVGVLILLVSTAVSAAFLIDILATLTTMLRATVIGLMLTALVLTLAILMLVALPLLHRFLLSLHRTRRMLKAASKREQ